MSMPISFRSICFRALAPCVLSACSDALSPAPAIDVAVSISDRQAPVPVSYQGANQAMLCDVTFEARALGQRARAIWQDSWVLFYALPNRGVPYDSVLIAANDVRATFAADTIAPGQVEHTRWLFATPVAIDISVSFRYQVDPGGDLKAAMTSFTCGGDESPAIGTRRAGITPLAGSRARFLINASYRPGLVTHDQQ
jgi:hypothetical protein